jgi:hypothetical protein
MSNRAALGLGAVVVGVIALDLLVFDWGLTLFAARRLSDLVEWLAFWR